MKNITILIILLMLLIPSVYPQQTIILQPGPDEGIDAKSRMLAPDTNYGDYRDITAHATDWLGPNVSRTFIKFDLSFLSPSTTIHEAKLNLYTADNLPNYPPGQYGDNGSLIQKIVENWDEHTLTHNEQPATDTIDQIILPPTTYQLQHFENIDITSFVVDMVQNPDSNFGIMIRLQTEIPNRCLCWCSSDYEIDTMRPKLVLTIDTCILPVPDFSYQQLGDTFYFTNLTDTADAYLWDFGDSTYSTFKNPSHVFEGFGLYNVCLTATNNSCGDSTVCQEIEYCEDVIADFTFGFYGMTVAFNDLSAHATSWYWDFGDGTHDSIQNPVHEYDSAGYYQVCLWAGNFCSNDTMCVTLDLNPAPLFSLNVENGACYFSCDAAGIETWFWDFGDGNYSTDPFPVHVYEEYGIYEVCLTITGSFGEMTDCSPIYFCPAPTAAFDYLFNHDTVVFINLTSDVNTWAWDFGNGQGSNIANPVCVYQEEGDYVVCLTVENECGSDVHCDTLVITGIEDKTTNLNSLNLYPNPSNDCVFFDFSNSLSKPTIISVYSTSGKLLRKIKTEKDFVMDVNDFPSGLYLIHVDFGVRTEIRKLQVYN